MERFRDAVASLGLRLNPGQMIPNTVLLPDNPRVLVKQIMAVNQCRLPEPLDNLAVDEHAADAVTGFPLTDMQYAYLIARNAAMPLGSIPAQHYIEMEVFKTDETRLAAALNQVVQLHPMMRAELTDNARQRIIQHVPPVQLAVEDTCGFSEEARSAYLQATRDAMHAAQALSDSTLPFRVQATRLPEGWLRLHLCFDLMFFDLLSIQLVLRDWWTFYCLPQREAKPVQLSFPSYISLQERLLLTPEGQRDVTYWRSKLATLSGPPELPLRQAPERIHQPRMQRIARTVPAGLVNQLRARAGDVGLTLETLFLGAFTEVLQKWSRRDAFSLTLTQFSRRPFSPDVSALVGNFLQPLLLTCAPAPQSTLVERWIDLQTELLLNRLHSACNGIQVLRDKTRLDQDGRAFSLPVVFSNTLDADLRSCLPDTGWEGTARIAWCSSQTPGVWLENQLMILNGELVMNWNYVADLFPEGMIDDLFQSVWQLLYRCAEEHAVWQRGSDTVPLPAAQQQRRDRANDTGCVFPQRLLHQSLWQAARANPDKVAVIQENQRITFGQLAATALQWQAQLEAQVKVRPGDIIAVSLPQGPRMLSAILAVLLAGAAYVVLDPALPEERKRRLLERTDARAVLGEAALPHASSPWLSVGEMLTHPQAALPEWQPRQQVSDLAYVIFTSGSTGEPKGVMISHQNAVNTLLDINQRFQVSAEDRVFSVAPAGFDLSVYDYFGVLGAGGSLVFAAANALADPKAWADTIKQQKVTLWNSVPAPVKALIEQGGEALQGSALRLILMSGDWIPPLICRARFGSVSRARRSSASGGLLKALSGQSSTRLATSILAGPVSPTAIRSPISGVTCSMKLAKSARTGRPERFIWPVPALRRATLAIRTALRSVSSTIPCAANACIKPGIWGVIRPAAR